MTMRWPTLYLRMILFFVFSLQSFGQAPDFNVPSQFPENFPENFDERWNLALPELQTGLQNNLGNLSTNQEFTIIETDEGILTYGFTGGQNVLNVTTGDDTYTSTASNVRFVPGLTTSVLSGEDLRFTSTTDDRITTIDRFRFGGSSDEFRLRLEGVDSVDDQSWGANTVNLNYSDDNWTARATQVYIKEENGDFVEIGSANFNQEQKTIQMTSVLGSQGGTNFSAAQLKLMRDGDTDRARVVDLYIADESGDFLKAGNAELAVTDDRRELSLANIDGSSEGYDFSATSINVLNDEDNTVVKATSLFIKDEKGSFIQIGTANYDDKAKTINMTSLLGSHEGYDFSAAQLDLMREGDTDKARAVDLYIGKGPNEFIKAGTADLSISPDRKALSLTQIDGSKDGYNFASQTFDISQTDENTLARATDVHVVDEDGNFVKIGEANFNEATQTIEMTSVLGEYDQNTLSAEQIRLMRNGDTDTASAVNLYLGRPGEEFIKAGNAELIISPDRKTLSLSQIDGRAEGYDFSADTFNAVEENDAIKGNATGIFIRNEKGEFVQIGQADFDEANKSLEMRAIVGEHSGINFRADEFGLFENDQGTTANGVNLFIAKEGTGFIKIGQGNLTLEDNREILRLTDFNGEAEGYEFKGDTFFGTHEDGFYSANITNGDISGDGNALSFSSALIEGSEDRVDGDFRNFTFSRDDLSYTSDRLIAGSDGNSFDLNTKGVLNTGSVKLDTHVNVRGVDRLILSGPATDGGILIEEDSNGNLKRAEGTVGIGTTEDGGIKDIGVSLGESIHFKATDKEGDAKELTASFSYNADAGQFYLKTVFKDGDETQIKVYPFTFTSEKVGDDAVAALSASIEKQNLQQYLRTMTGIIDMEKVNDFLSVGSRGQMQVRLGGDKGMEFYFANDNFSAAQGNDFFGGPQDDGLALGFGIFNRGAEGDSAHSGGILISSDSSLRYEVEHGTLAFNGLELPDTGRIPLTIGSYYKYEDDRGNAVFGTLGTSLADLGSVSGGVTIRRQVGEDAYLSLGGTANTRGDFAAMVGFQMKFGAPRVNNSSRYQNDYHPSLAGDAARSIYGQGASFK